MNIKVTGHAAWLWLATLCASLVSTTLPLVATALPLPAQAQVSTVPAPTALGTQQATPSTRDIRFEAALVDYERSHWADAYAALALLADEGHAEAARIALQMARHGRVLYGLNLAATALQLQRWSQAAGCKSETDVIHCRVAMRGR